MRLTWYLMMVGACLTWIPGCGLSAAPKATPQTVSQNDREPPRINVQPTEKVQPHDLLEAAGKGEISRIRRLLELGLDVNDKDENGQTALMRASAKGQVAAVTLLLEKRGEVNEKDAQGRTAIMLAAENNHLAVLKLLLSSGMTDVDQAANAASNIVQQLGVSTKIPDFNKAELNARDVNGETAFIKAAVAGHSDALQVLIDARADSKLKDNQGRNALMRACDAGQYATARLLVSNYDWEATNGQGDTAFALAAEHGNIELLDLMVQHWGVDYAAGMAMRQNLQGVTPLMKAVEKGHSTTVDYLIRKVAAGNPRRRVEYLQMVDKSGRTAEQYAVQGNHAEIAKLLHDFAAIDEKDAAGRTPLMRAVAEGNVEQVSQLLAQGADPDQKDAEGRSLLLQAVKAGQVEVVKLLLVQKADKELQDKQGETAFLLALAQDNRELRDLFAGAGYETVSRRNRSGLTPLMQTVEKGDADSARFVLRCVATNARTKLKGYLTLQNKQGKTAEQMAESSPAATELKALFAEYAEVDKKDENGQTALMLAAEKGELQLVKELKAKGADPTIRDKSGETALFHAVHKNHVHVVRELLTFYSDAEDRERSDWLKMVDNIGRRADGYTAYDSEIAYMIKKYYRTE